MKVSDRALIFGVVIGALAIAFYMLVLAPKRDEASKLTTQIDDLNASIAQKQQVADFAEQARKDFPRYYGRLVVLGKAVPARADTSSMLVQLKSVASRSTLRLNSIALGQSGSGSSDTSSTAAASSTSTASTSTTASSESATASVAAPATESSAASQPLGAVVGAAGLPTLPYELGLQGSYFDVSHFIGGLDGLVTPTDNGTQVSPDGRLFTIDGFALQINGTGLSPRLDASFLVTTYVTPETQGLTGGASPSGPAPATPATPETQPASAVVAK